MATYKQPVGQKRLTNIAVVRVRKHGLRFEVACYKNKVMSWRAGIEKDIDEVLQTHTIFANVGKGTLAKAVELVKAFGTDDEDVVCRKILAEGEYQVSDKEREMVAGSLLKDVLFMVMERTVNPATQRPYSLAMIEKFAQEVHFSVDPSKNSKQQALDLIRQLVQRFPIVRARMELRLTVPSAAASQESALCKQHLPHWGAVVGTVARDEPAGTTSLVFQVDPAMYRQCDAWAQANGGRLEVLAAAVQASGDMSFDRLEDVGAERRGQPDTIEAETGAGGGGLSTPPVTEVATRLGEVSLGVGSSSQDLGRSAEADRPRQGPQEPAKVVAAGLQMRCTTCLSDIESREGYREHCKSEWHKHNMRRKARQLPPLSAEQCAVDMELNAKTDDRDEFL